MIRTRVVLLLTALPSRVRVTRADDAYVQLRSLELELRRLHLEGRRHLVYGSINMCAMPSTLHKTYRARRYGATTSVVW